MKGKRPTRKQKLILKKNNLNPDNWAVVQNLIHKGELHIVSLQSGNKKVVRI